MCEKCDAIKKKLTEGAVATVEERVALTAITGSLIDEHGPEVVVDLLANALGFLDYRTRTKFGDEKGDEMKSLLVSLLEDYYATSSDLTSERAQEEDIEVTGTIH